MSTSTKPRIFFDTNVFIEGLLVNFSPPRAILIMARFGVFQLVLCPAVIDETEAALSRLWERAYQDGSRQEHLEADKRFSRVIDEYGDFLRLSNPERVERATPSEIQECSSYIRHQHDVPVLAEAIKAQPDWLITTNTNHFNEEVAIRTGLRIINQFDFLRLWSISGHVR